MQAGNDRDQFSSFKLYSLIDISKKINALLNIDDLLALIIDSCAQLLDSESSSLMLVDDENQVLNFHIIADDNAELRKISVPIGVGIAGIVAQTGEPIITNDAVNDPRVFKEPDEKTNIVTRNIVCVPLISRNRVIGVIEAINTIDRDGFDNDDLLLLMAFAEQAAISITNNQLYERIRTRADELSALHDVSQLALHYDAEESMLRASISIVSRVMHCKYSMLQLYNEKEKTLELLAHTGSQTPSKAALEETFALQAIQSHSAVFAENITIDPRFTAESHFSYTTRSFICMPMQTKARPIGVIMVMDRMDGGSFDSNDVRVLQTIATQISDVYENIRLNEAKKDTIRRDKELEITRRLQNAILPKGFPTINRMDIYGINRPAMEVGGDFYDFFYDTENPDEFLACIADVSGKSIPAALFMAVTRSILRAQVINRRSPSPAKIYESANNLAYADSDSAMFVTSFLFHCDLKNMRLTYSSAGHNDPLLLRRGEDKARLLHTKGLPLAVKLGAPFLDESIDVMPGDTIVLYTDGLVEANDKDNEEYEMERFEETLLACRDLSAKEITEKLIESVDLFASNVPQFDDITVFVFKFLD